MKPVRIGRRLVGPGRPVYVIAEVGSNHDGSLAQAKRLIAAAAKAGADAVKFQSILYDKIFAAGAYGAEHRRFFTQLELPESWYPALKKSCDEHGVDFLSCPTYSGASDAIAAAGAPVIKIASPQTKANPQLIAEAAVTGLPLIMSTGYCSMDEIAAAVRVAERAGVSGLILLHCLSEYPARPERINLRVMAELERRFRRPAGFSDHTLGLVAPAAAVALGACAIEKHITLDRNGKGPDHPFATEPREFADMVKALRETSAMLGDGVKGVTEGESRTARSFQLRLVAGRDLPRGARVARADLVLRRAPSGLTPDDIRRVLGRRLRRAVPAAGPLTEAHLEVRR